jgi:hypothetical protein
VDYQYQTIVHKFLVDYLQGGEGRSPAKCAVEGVGEAHGRGCWRSARSGVSMCSGAGATSVLWVKRLRARAKRSSSVEGEEVNATTCSRGEAVEGALRRRHRALGVGGAEACSISGRGDDGGVEDLKCVGGKNLLSVEKAARAHDIYSEVHHSFFQAVTHYFWMRDAHLVRRVILLFPMGNMWVPDG